MNRFGYKYEIGSHHDKSWCYLGGLGTGSSLIFFLVPEGPKARRKFIGQFFVGMIPAEAMRPPPSGERLIVVADPPIPITVTRPLNLPGKLLSALRALAMLQKSHR